MAWNCALLLRLGAADYKIPTLGISERADYVPLVAAGALIVLFSIEHIIALAARHRSGARMALTILGVSFFGLLILGRAGRVRDRPVGASRPSCTKACRWPSCSSR